ncbi:MAG: outer membrane beta-barrel protein, partial [Sphingomonas oligoaromativorans]
MLALSILCLGATPLMGQDEQRDMSIMSLPRPGYEPRTLTAGGFLLVPSLEADATYNDNIFATPDRRKGDTVFDIQPRLTGELKRSTFDL